MTTNWELWSHKSRPRKNTSCNRSTPGYQECPQVLIYTHLRSRSATSDSRPKTFTLICCDAFRTRTADGVTGRDFQAPLNPRPGLFLPCKHLKSHPAKPSLPRLADCFRQRTGMLGVCAGMPRIDRPKRPFSGCRHPRSKLALRNVAGRGKPFMALAAAEAGD
jgi:hypothetical protein